MVPLKGEKDISKYPKWMVVGALFAFCIAPTFISYRPYVFRWDDSDYLRMSIAVSQAFWSKSLHGVAHLRAIGAAMYSFRPPMMTLLGLPWGPLASWDAAGKCFLTLAALISLMAATCLYLLLRIGIMPIFLVLASVCTLAALGPFPAEGSAHLSATAFMADNLFAWITLAALLLIPYEARSYGRSIRDGLAHGLLWGSILSLGLMTKINFLYFVVLIVPWLLVIRLRHGGQPSACASLVALAGCSAPSVLYLVRHGQAAFENAKASSFGTVADFYYASLSQYLGRGIRESPGLALSLALVAVAVAYLLIKKRAFVRDPCFLAILIATGFACVVLASTNRQFRYAFPAIVALPFLVAIPLSGKERPTSRIPAALSAVLAFVILLAVAVPTRYRADQEQSLGRCEAVLAQAVRSHARRILLATDSPSLNGHLMGLAIAVSRTASSVEMDTLADRALSGVPIEKDFEQIREADQVIFQDKDELEPPFKNQRVSEYEQYVQQQCGCAPTRVGGDLSVYALRLDQNLTH